MLIQQIADVEGASESSATFVFNNEGHTLGNALRFIISSYPDVEFCGYTVPYPSEPKMHFRIQMGNLNERAIEALKRGLEDLSKFCDQSLDLFDAAVSSFKPDG